MSMPLKRTYGGLFKEAEHIFCSENVTLQNARGKKGKDTQRSVVYAKAGFPNFCYLGCTSTVGMSEHHVQY